MCSLDSFPGSDVPREYVLPVQVLKVSMMVVCQMSVKLSRFACQDSDCFSSCRSSPLLDALLGWWSNASALLTGSLNRMCMCVQCSLLRYNMYIGKCTNLKCTAQ